MPCQDINKAEVKLENGFFGETHDEAVSDFVKKNSFGEHFGQEPEAILTWLANVEGESS